MEPVTQSSIEQKFKDKVLRDGYRITEIPKKGIQNLFEVRNDFDFDERKRELYEIPILVTNKTSLRMRLPTQTPCNLQFIRECYGEGKQFEASISVDQQPPKNAKPMALKLVERFFMTNEKERKESISIENIPPTEEHRRKYECPPLQNLANCYQNFTKNSSGSRSKLIGVSSSNFFSPFKRSESGMLLWHHQFAGSQLFCFVEPPPDDENADIQPAMKSFGILPTKCDIQVLALKLNQGETLLVPGDWSYAFLTLEDSIVYYGLYLMTQLIPKHIRAHEQNLSTKGIIYDTFDDVMVAALPQVIVDIYGMYYRARSLDDFDVIQEIIYSYISRFRNSKVDPSFLSILEGIHTKQLQMFEKGLCKHITGAVFKRADYENFELLLFNGVLCNVKAGESWRESLHAGAEDEDFCPKIPQGFQPMEEVDYINMSQNDLIMFELANNDIVAVALDSMKENTCIGEVRGELFSDTQLKMKHATLCPSGPVHHLTCKKNEKNKFLENIWLDASYSGGANKYFKTGSVPNCKIQKTYVSRTVKLMMWTTAAIRKGEKFVLPFNTNDDVNGLMPAETLSVFSHDSRRKGYAQFESIEKYEEWNNIKRLEKGITMRYTCTDAKCGKDYKHFNLFHKHLLAYHLPYPLVCSYRDCGKGYVQKQELDKHEERHKALGNP